MLFFQTVLLLGYSYALFLSKFSLKKQLLLHSFVVLSIVIVQGTILPDITVKPSDTLSPILQVLFLLSIAVGLPYFLLCTTSIVLQKWFSLIQFEKSPYPLYALSNIASLLALVSYPILVEPFFRLAQQGEWWRAGFLLYGIFLLICCGQTFFSTHTKKEKKTTQLFVIKSKTAFIWLILSAISTLMLLAITNMLTQSIAPIPFLWLLPLSLYLLSFIVCFSGKKWYCRNLYAYLFLLTAPFILIFTFSAVPSLLLGILIYSLVLFSCCMLCHGELYLLRPTRAKLDTFYVFIALGSVISGIFVGIVAPLIFRGFWELYLAFYLCFFVAFAVLLQYKNSFFYRRMSLFFSSTKEIYWSIAIGFPFVLVTVGIILNGLNGYSSVTTWRSFYGVLAVKEKKLPGAKQQFLMHGNIVHGSQFTSTDLRFKPTAYYTEKSGVGLALKNVQQQKEQMAVGIIGLGVGTLAAYGRDGDSYIFYEINPQVVQLAKERFTYLSDSKAKSEIVLGDGRLSLAKEKRTFDLLILDAFSDDAIPVHLLTKEAFAMYLTKINAQGVIAVHISNNYIDLNPLLQQVAKYFNLSTVTVFSPASDNASAAEWVLLTRDKSLLSLPMFISAAKKGKYKSVALWTDDYSNLFQFLK